ncbi:carbohydrate ABC transporter permease [Streptomyces europaeiscabiei]|uniref:carbohydrate ABC transporter permease n=1 Tax=Streptomyces europaeiscabiei TaxID=146819 RepID=UPI0038F7A52C
MAAKKPVPVFPIGARSGTSREILWMLVPGIVILLVFFGLPILDLVRTSFSQWSGVGERSFTGLDNYRTVFTDPAVRDALVRSVMLGVGAAIGISLVATILAAFVSGGIRGGSLYRILWFLPAVAPPSAVAVFWALSVQPRSGAVNAFLGAIGFGDTHAWLADPESAIYVIIGVAIWQGVGFAFLIVLGAMEDVPVSTYEAASIDGCSRPRQFFSITLPLVRPVLSMVVLLEVIWAFNGFTLVWGMTQGGPGDATAILPVKVYKDAFMFADFGTAAAVSIVGGVVLLVLGVVGQSLGSKNGADE